MDMKVLDAVVLEKDLPGHCLRKGDIGAVVEVYEPDGVEVECRDRCRKDTGACDVER